MRWIAARVYALWVLNDSYIELISVSLKEDSMKRLIVFTLMLFAWLAPAAADSLPLASLKLPPGFEIELFARVPNTRQMALGKNTLFVGSMRARKVYAIPLRGARKPVGIDDGLDV